MDAPSGYRLILASASPRRRRLLALLGLPFEVRASGVDETPRDGETALDYVSRVARDKAQSISSPPSPAATETGEPRLVIAADTEVVCQGEIFGKPKDGDEATRMLRQLRGRTHEVISVVAVREAATGRAAEAVCRGPVPMRAYADEEIAAYVASGDALDKAGAYAIQHDGFHPVENFRHCYASVMGLPLCHLTRVLRSFGLNPPADVPQACRQFLNYDCPVHGEILDGA